MRLHHVQISMPPDGEDAARSFYRDALGLTEVPKPADLAGRGGCWFRALDGNGRTAAEVHVGVEEAFHAQRKAHPAFLVGSVADLEALGHGVAAAGFEVSWTERGSFEGFQRFHCYDGFGNRVEVLAEDA